MGVCVLDEGGGGIGTQKKKNNSIIDCRQSQACVAYPGLHSAGPCNRTAQSAPPGQHPDRLSPGAPVGKGRGEGGA